MKKMEYLRMQKFHTNVQCQAMSDPSWLMKQVNEANWYYHVESLDGFYKRPIGDLDCIKINLRMQKLQNGEKIN